MKFKVLGSLALYDHGPRMAPSAPKTRNLLALLLLNANTPLSQSVCIDELWPFDVPRSAVQSLHTRVLHIRQTLAALPSVGSSDAAKTILVTHNRGYTLCVEYGSLDLHDFEQHLKSARQAELAQDDLMVSLSLRAALDLWNGPVLGDTPSGPRLQPRIISLEEQRITVLEKCMESELRLGLHQELLHELHSLTVQYPTHENFHAQYMLALYRSGRAAQALVTYRTLRDNLVNEVGIEPSHRLREIQNAVLVESPDLGTRQTHGLGRPSHLLTVR
jgi:DNA-binding SARP family transcriptional activator